MHCTIDDLAKLGLRIATVVEAEAVSGSEKLLKLHIDLGDEQRQVVSGIAKSYTPQELLGKQVVFVSNLEPRTILGVESNGMLLCADDEAGPVLLSPLALVKPGAAIR